MAYVAGLSATGVRSLRMSALAADSRCRRAAHFTGEVSTARLYAAAAKAEELLSVRAAPDHDLQYIRGGCLYWSQDGALPDVGVANSLIRFSGA